MVDVKERSVAEGVRDPSSKSSQSTRRSQLFACAWQVVANDSPYTSIFCPRRIRERRTIRAAGPEG